MRRSATRCVLARACQSLAAVRARELGLHVAKPAPCTATAGWLPHYKATKHQARVQAGHTLTPLVPQSIAELQASAAQAASQESGYRRRTMEQQQSVPDPGSAWHTPTSRSQYCRSHLQQRMGRQNERQCECIVQRLWYCGKRLGQALPPCTCRHCAARPPLQTDVFVPAGLPRKRQGGQYR